ncbi:hypothetical protein MRX96_035905 [Rhipicephalus microplus]
MYRWHMVRSEQCVHCREHEDNKHALLACCVAKTFWSFVGGAYRPLGDEVTDNNGSRIREEALCSLSASPTTDTKVPGAGSSHTLIPSEYAIGYWCPTQRLYQHYNATAAKEPVAQSQGAKPLMNGRAPGTPFLTSHKQDSFGYRRNTNQALFFPLRHLGVRGGAHAILIKQGRERRVLARARLLPLAFIDLSFASRAIISRAARSANPPG